jgi:PAS domain S-box-containing protein
MKILIVDDDLNSRVFLERALLSQGYNVETAPNGIIALEKAQQSPPDIIISDILMPEMDGYELCRRIKTDERFWHIPFVFYTATYVDPKDEKLALYLGASKYLIKSMEPEKLLQKIREVIEDYKTHKLPLPKQPLIDTNELDRLQLESVVRKLDKKVRELEEERQMLRKAKNDWENIFHAISSPTMIVDNEYNILRTNKAFVKVMRALTENDLIGKKCYEVFHNTTEPPKDCPLQKALISWTSSEGEIVVEAMGKIFHVACTPIFDELDEKRTLQKIIHIATDITKFKEIEKELLLQQKLLTAINKAQQNFIVQDEKSFAFDSLLSDILEITNSEYGVIGEVLYTQEGKPYLKVHTITNISWDETTLRLYNEKAQEGFEFYNLKNLFGHTILTGQTVISNDPQNDPRSGGLPNGHPPLKAYLGIPIKQGRNIIAMVGIANRPGGYSQEQIDLLQPFLNTIGQLVESRKIFEAHNKAEKALQKSEQIYRSLFEDHSAVKLLIDPETGDIVDANKAASMFYGWSREELKQMKIQQINISPHEEIKKAIEEIKKGKRTTFEFRHRLADGSIKEVRVFSSAIKLKDKEYLHGIIHDITKEKELEAKLYQSQKMESIGRLAGGIAHDFNNMLNVILGYGEIILSKLNQNDPLYKQVSAIVEAGKRSKSLTQKLLAFSRKQIFQPKVFNINKTLASMENMLKSLIGEDIELVMVLSKGLYNIETDPTQIEQVIMNLVVNARDAMPFGGKLIIETANVYLDEEYAKNHVGVISGKYVKIAVTDTGVGMDKDTLSHIFEPFFTTKLKEKGTGLGLSTAYGIIKQSGGNIWVYSEVGKGTTFKIYLPAVFQESEPEKKEIEKVSLKVKHEHILVVEDEPALRELLETFLTTLGYKVTIASNGEEALLLIEEKGLKPVLVITDVVMPIMSGVELVKRLKNTLPDVKVLYMSGYTDNVIVHHRVFDSETPFIQKPFNMNELALKIEQLLGSKKT